MKSRTWMVAVVVGWACGGAEASDVPEHKVTLGLDNGVYVAFAADDRGTAQANDSSVIVRSFLDPSACTFFGYEIDVHPAANDQILVRLSPLSPSGERRVRVYLKDDAKDCEAPVAITLMDTRFPPPQVLSSGEGLSVDLLANPLTGAVLMDRFHVSRRPFSRPVTWSDEPADDLRVETLPFGVTEGTYIRVNGKELDRKRGGFGCRGTLMSLFLGTGERFVFSLVPRDGHDFRKVGLADGNRLAFTWDGVRYEWIGGDPVVGKGVRAPMWVLRDDGYGKVKPVYGCAVADTVEKLIGRR